MLIPGAPFHMNAKSLGMAAISQEKISKVIQSPYSSVKISALCATLMVLSDFPESLSIATGSICRKSCSAPSNC